VTTLPVSPALADPPEVAPRKLARTATGGDRVFELTATSIGALVLLITGGIGAFLAWQSIPTLERYGWAFFTESAWQPEADVLGIGAVLVGTISVAAVAMVIAFPLALLRPCSSASTRPRASSRPSCRWWT
jgi:phosphate transport system permease protein